MNKLLVFTCFIFTVQLIIGQRKHWTNDFGEKCKKGQATRFYTTKKEKTSNLFLKEYYLYDKKNPYETTHFKTKKCIIKQGESKTFYSNGSLKEVGNFINNKKDEEWISYYQNGKSKSIINYRNGVKNGSYICYYQDNTTITGSYKNNQKDLLWSTSNGSNKLIETSYFKDGYRHGKTVFYHKNGNIKQSDYYEKGELIESKRFDINGQLLQQEEEIDEILYSIVEEQPEFPGGMNKLMQFLGKNTQYPPTAIDNNIQGRAFIRFIVEKDGSITNVRPVRSGKVHPLLEEEAIRVVSSMPKWVPGRQRGKQVRTEFTIPINFKIH